MEQEEDSYLDKTATYRIYWTTKEGCAEEIFCTTRTFKDEIIADLKNQGLDCGWEKV